MLVLSAVFDGFSVVASLPPCGVDFDSSSLPSFGSSSDGSMDVSSQKLVKASRFRKKS